MPGTVDHRFRAMGDPMRSNLVKRGFSWWSTTSICEGERGARARHLAPRRGGGGQGRPDDLQGSRPPRRPSRSSRASAASSILARPGTSWPAWSRSIRSWQRRLAAQLASRGIAMVDAP